MGILLLILMNIAVMAVANITLAILQSAGIISLSGDSIASLMVIFGVMGFGGAFVSLFLSKWMVKRSMGVQVIENPRGEFEQWYVDEVKLHSKRAGIPTPEIGIFEGAPNAFATGATKSSSLVAISTGLAHGMNKNEISGVIAHEIAHIKNGDMVTMTLLQGLINTFVMLFSHIIGRAIDKAIFKSDRPGMGYYISRFFVQIVLTFLASIAILMPYSRYREYKADAGGASIGGRENMIAALAKLKNLHTEPLPDEQKAFGIVGFFDDAFSTHPSLDKRIAKLREEA